MLENIIMECIESNSEDDSSTTSNSISSDDENTVIAASTQRKKRNCIKNYFENVVPLYTDSEFKKHFRINRHIFTVISEKFEQCEEYKKLEHYNTITAQKHVAIFLWFAGHEACSYRDIADRFDISLWTVHTIIYRVTNFISNMASTVIVWPNENQKKVTAKYFLSNKGFPGIIGCIDGTHIVIDPPKHNSDEYIDRKGNTSICLQAVCNENKKFTDIFIGFPGSTHDSRMFKNSHIYRKLFSLKDYYLLGDSAYPCLKMLLVPYKDNGHLTRAQKKFNINLSSCRVYIEHSFGILKQRFRQLYYCKLRGMEILCHFIRACCVLHNLADNNDFEIPLENISESNESSETLETYNEESGKELRDEICRQIFVQ